MAVDSAAVAAVGTAAAAVVATAAAAVATAAEVVATAAAVAAAVTALFLQDTRPPKARTSILSSLNKSARSFLKKNPSLRPDLVSEVATAAVLHPPLTALHLPPTVLPPPPTVLPPPPMALLVAAVLLASTLRVSAKLSKSPNSNSPVAHLVATRLVPLPHTVHPRAAPPVATAPPSKLILQPNSFRTKLLHRSDDRDNSGALATSPSELECIYKSVGSHVQCR